MSQPRLLVVDDDRYAREALSAVLRLRDLAVDTAENGREALELASCNDYALAILDYQLPDMTGAELLRGVRSTRPEFPAIFVTAFTRIDTVFPAVEAGAERVLAKPFDSEELLKLVDELVAPN